MEIILLILHLAGMAGILISLLSSRTKLSAGVTHSALLSFITGLALVGIRYPLVDADPVKWEEVDNNKISIKLLILFAILVVSYINRKKEYVSKVIIGTLAVFVIVNTSLAIV